MLKELHILKIMKDENCSWEEATEKKKEIIDLENFF
tara:strand:+ start:536 stop:643 length:108 start_codon:yes stop_codon:yes gene_type:complete